MEGTENRGRTVIAYHEAAHAVIALAANWYHGEFVQIDPGDRPDRAGVHRVVARPWEWEQPWQRLEIAVGGFLVDAAGWLAERRLFNVTGWSHEGYGCGSWGYDYEDGSPAWDSFYEGELLGQTDPVTAIEWLSKAGVTLGISAPTNGMRREVEATAADMVITCWPSIEALARELDKTGRVDDLRRYWTQGSIETVERLCGKWVRRFAHRHPDARGLIPRFHTSS